MCRKCVGNVSPGPMGGYTRYGFLYRKNWRMFYTMFLYFNRFYLGFPRVSLDFLGFPWFPLVFLGFPGAFKDLVSYRPVLMAVARL